MAQRDHGTIEYQPFPNEGPRNWRQEHVEIPLMLRALGLPRRVRVLEVGCGRGVALPVLAQHLEPARLVGVDVDRSLLDVADGCGRRRLEPSWWWPTCAICPSPIRISIW
jgi:protein-L-isoaspartate O-methyltransferase